MERKTYKLKPTKGPLPRDLSIGSFSAYAGTAKNLIEGVERADTRNCHRAFKEVGVCPAIEALQYYYTIDGCVPVWHSPRGCAQWSTLVDLQIKSAQMGTGRPITRKKVITTDMTTNEVVFGGEEKLRKVILEVDQRYQPELIPIVSTCASGIIGDNLEAVAEDLKGKVKAQILPLHCEGFKTTVWGSAFDFAAYPLVYQVMEEPRKIEKDLLNVITMWTSSIFDQLEMERLLKKAGIRPRFYPRFATVEDIRRAPEAVANAMLCVSQGLPFAEYMYDRFGTPYSEVNQTLGIEQTGRWLRRAAQLTGKEAEMEKVIQEEEAELYEKLEPIKKRLKGKKVYIDAGHGRGPATVKFCCELGMDVIGLSCFYYDQVINPDMKDIIRYVGEDFPVIVSDIQFFEVACILHREKPDLYIADGGLTPIAARMGIPNIPIQMHEAKGPHTGYRGAYSFAKDMLMMIENPGLPKRLGKYFDAYKESWLKGDPFQHIPKDMVRF